MPFGEVDGLRQPRDRRDEEEVDGADDVGFQPARIIGRRRTYMDDGAAEANKTSLVVGRGGSHEAEAA